MLAHQGVDLKRRPPKSRPDRAAGPKASSGRRQRSAGTPPSTFLFLPIHLSNSPGPLGVPSPHKRGKEPPKSHTSDRAGCCSPSGSVRGFADTPSRRRRRAKKSYIGFRGRECQPSKLEENAAEWQFRLAAADTPKAPGEGAISRCARRTAATFLRRSYTIVSGMSQCGGAAASAKLFGLGGQVAVTRPGGAHHPLSP